MRIRVVGQAGEPVFPFGTDGPWVKFKSNLINEKDVLITQKFGEKIDVLICHGYSKDAISEARKSKVPKNKMVLVLWEPPIIHPKLHSDKYLSNFGHIYAPSKEWAKKHNAVYFNWPTGKIKSKLEVSDFKTRQNNAVIIQRNKVNFLKDENYSLRRIVLFKSLRLKYPITLYGSGWEKLPSRQMIKAFVNLIINFKHGVSKNAVKHTKTQYPYYRGEPKNKFTTLKKYKISIVIENHNSYISEKIFDSLNSGCITIYVGPNLMDYGLNKNIAIQSDADANSILLSLEKIMKLNNKKLLEIHKMQSYYMKKVAKNWNSEIVLKNLAKSIRSEIEK
jgi:hypothetical protein